MRHILFVAAFVLSGSVLADSRPQSLIDFEELTARGNAAYTVLGDCRQAAADSPVGGRLINAKIITNSDSPEKLEILTTTSKLNKQQKKILVDFLILNQRCQENFLQVYGQNELAQIKSKYFSIKDYIFVDMLNGKISIGEGNKRLLEAQDADSKELRDTLKAMHDIVNRDIRDAHQRREADRQAALQSIERTRNFIRSTDSSPSQSFTNCTKNFDSINCSTLGY